MVEEGRTGGKEGQLHSVQKFALGAPQRGDREILIVPR